MATTSFIFAAYLFFAIYCAGTMSVLQLQHFSLYGKVGKEDLKTYIKANNKAAFLPSILPAILLLILTIILLFIRPPYMPIKFVVVSLSMNLVNMVSTAIWQGRIHGQLEKVGYNESLLTLLIKTNWIRTIALLFQGLIAIYCVMEILK